MRVWSIRSLFAFVGIALVAQFVYAYTDEEPFPSFVFPNFQGVPDHGGPVHLLQPRLVVRFEGTQGVEHLSYARLLSDAPGVVADAVAYSALAPASSRAHTTPELFRLFLEQPSVTRGDTALSAQLRDPRTRRWLRHRLMQLYPDQSPRSVTVVWDEHRYRTRDGSVHETITPVSRLRVPLAT
jgi:hypothetical protein